MPTLIPSILEKNKEAFQEVYNQEIKLPGVSRIQVDFGDGIFVPNKMVSPDEIDVLNPAYCFEAHLMCQEPTDFLDYQIAGFHTIIIHFEAFKHPSQLRLALQEIRRHGMEPAICLNPETPVEVLKEFENETKHFQLMGIHPGFQGTPFLEETLSQIAKLRELCPNAILEVDGGIHETNIKQIAEAGADLLVLGSSITKAPNMQEAWERLQAEIS